MLPGSDHTNEARRLFLHVGYPKTGSTSLQRNLFRKHPQVFNFRTEIEGVDQFREAVLSENKFHGERHRELLAQFCNEGDSKTGVYSDERFTRILGDQVEPNQDDIARRLASVFSSEFETHVIIVLRRQQDLLLSAWAFWQRYYDQRGYEDVNDIVHRGAKEAKTVARRMLDWAQYTDTLQCFTDHFGEDRIHIFLYENLNQSPKRFVQRLSRTLGIEPERAQQLMSDSVTYNTSRKDGEYHKTTKLYRLLSILKSTYFPKMPPVRQFAIGEWIIESFRKTDEKVTLSHASRRKIKDLYAEGNREIENTFGVPLEDHGYYV